MLTLNRVLRQSVLRIVYGDALRGQIWVSDEFWYIHILRFLSRKLIEMNLEGFDTLPLLYYVMISYAVSERLFFSVSQSFHSFRQQMPPTLPGQLTMEKTPSYFVTKAAPRRIHQMSKKTKLIVVVRDPVTRAISDYTQTASKRPNIKSFQQLAFLNSHTGLVNTSWGAIRIGVYARHLERWLKYFPIDQMHFVSGENLIRNPAQVMDSVQSFLGLRKIVNEEHFYFNETKGFPCLKKRLHNGSPHCLGDTKGRPHPNISEKVKQRLRAFYRPFNAKFYQMTNIDFGWLWDLLCRLGGKLSTYQLVRRNAPLFLYTNVVQCLSRWSVNYGHQPVNKSIFSLNVVTKAIRKQIFRSFEFQSNLSLMYLNENVVC